MRKGIIRAVHGCVAENQHGANAFAVLCKGFNQASILPAFLSRRLSASALAEAGTVAA